MHHWIQNEEMRVLMKRLGAESAQHWPESLPDDPETALTQKERNEGFRNAARLASALAASADELSSHAAGLEISESDRSAFAGSARVLCEQAMELGRATRRHDIEAMQRHLDSIRATCIACHTRFKDISGELPPRA